MRGLDRPGRRFRSVLRRVVVDVTPMRASRDYRLLWWMQLLSSTGSQITVAAVFWQVYRIRQSPAAVGLVGLAQLAPMALAAVVGGPLIDRLDRKRILVFAQALGGVGASLLLVNARAAAPNLAIVYLGAAIVAVAGGLTSPARASMIPRLVGPELLPSALALGQVMWNGAQIVGPAIGGVIIGKLGLSWAFGADVISYAAAISLVWLIAPMEPLVGEEERTSGPEAIREAFRYLGRSRVLRWNFGVDLVAMIFGMPRALFPILVVTQFHRGPVAFGWLNAAVAIGALLGAASAGWVGRVERQGRAVIVAVAVWGVGISAFGFAGSNLWLGIALLALAGAADVVSAVFRGTILQTTVPDSLRGRMSALNILVVTGGPRLGDVEAGLVASAVTPMFSVVTGGVACVVGMALVAALVPAYRDYRAPGA